MSKRRLFLICLLLLASCWVGDRAYSAIRDKCEMNRRLHQIGQVFLASKLYASDHGGQMPAALEELSSLTSKWDGHCFFKPGSSPGAFLLRASRELELLSPGVADTAFPCNAFLRERYPDKHGIRVICRLDGTTMLAREHP